MPAQLAGKVAIVTGGGSGIGRATALAMAREGAGVVIADAVVSGGEDTMQQIRAAGGEALFVHTDVTQPKQVEALVTTAVETYGRVDCAYNNAGIEGVLAPLTECTEENWDRVLTINLKGVWLCMKYEILQMQKQASGAIVNTASMHGLVGGPRNPAYVASKHGVVGLTKSAALAYAPAGIRVNAVCPGYIRTPMLERVLHIDPGLEPRMLALEPVGRLGTPEEVAATVVWLCSEAASFITGHALAVDGGYLAQ